MEPTTSNVSDIAQSPNTRPSTAKLWQRATHKVQAANRFKTTLHHDIAKKVDAYSLEERPGTIVGGIMTFLVIAATIAYVAYVLIQWFNRPYITMNYIEWSAGFGPYPFNLTCRSQSGCYISNSYTAKWASSAASEVPHAQQGCTVLQAGESRIYQVAFSQYPSDGLSFMYDANTTTVGMPPGFGVLVHSDVRCWPDNPAGGCNQGIIDVPTPIGAGISLGSYVKTDNISREDAGRLRHEWFMTRTSMGVATLPDYTSCWDLLNVTQKATYVQAIVRMQTFWNHIKVERSETWQDLWGICGGAYGLFLQIGAIILLLVNAIYNHFQKGAQVSSAPAHGHSERRPSVESRHPSILGLQNVWHFRRSSNSISPTHPMISQLKTGKTGHTVTINVDSPKVENLHHASAHSLMKMESC